MTKINVILKGDGLFPADDAAEEVMRGNRQGREYLIDLRGNRNPKFHRLAMKVFSIIADALDIPMDALRMWCKDKLYEFDLVEMPDGSKRRVYHSHAFESMDDARFKRHMDRCVHVMFTELLPGADWHSLRDEVLQIYAGRWYEPAMAA